MMSGVGLVCIQLLRGLRIRRCFLVLLLGIPWGRWASCVEPTPSLFMLFMIESCTLLPIKRKELHLVDTLINVLYSKYYVG